MIQQYEAEGWLDAPLSDLQSEIVKLRASGNDTDRICEIMNIARSLLEHEEEAIIDHMADPF